MVERLSYTVIVLLLGSLLVAAIGFFRWDKRLSAPLAYEAGQELGWYEEKRSDLAEFNLESISGLERRLERQGFTEETAARGFNRSDGVRRWYVFEVEEGDRIFAVKYMTALGLCSQTAGVAINTETKEVRLLKPGGTCV